MRIKLMIAAIVGFEIVHFTAFSFLVWGATRYPGQPTDSRIGFWQLVKLGLEEFWSYGYGPYIILIFLCGVAYLLIDKRFGREIRDEEYAKKRKELEEEFTNKQAKLKQQWAAWAEKYREQAKDEAIHSWRHYWEDYEKALEFQNRKLDQRELDLRVREDFAYSDCEWVYSMHKQIPELKMAANELARTLQVALEHLDSAQKTLAANPKASGKTRRLIKKAYKIINGKVRYDNEWP